MAQFGSPSLTNSEDWIKIVPPTTTEKTWSDDNNACSGVVGYDVEFLYSLVGFEHQLQKYIVGAKIREIKEDWVYYYQDGTADTKQSFNHLLQISFHQVLPEALLTGDEGDISWGLPKLPLGSLSAF